MIDRFVLNVIYDRFNTAVFPMSLCWLRFSLTLLGRFEQLRVRTHWTDRIVWPDQKSRQNLSLPNLSLRTETQQNIC